MGFGDFKLLAAGGAWLGWQALPQVALLAAASGLAYALTARLRGRLDPGQALPFGPSSPPQFGSPPSSAYAETRN